MKESRTLDDWLESISILPPGMASEDNRQWPVDWHAVADDDGIIAYFSKPEDAFRFRLSLINSIINPVAERYKKL